MKVNIEEIEAIYNRLNEINSVPIEEIEWFRNNCKVTIDSKTIDEWKFVGLSNSHFPEYALLKIR